jgi:hypothetical protein
MSYYPPIYTPKDFWDYVTRTLTQTKFPFWSAMITAQHNYITISGGSTGSITIRPPSGEVWLVWIDQSFFGNTAGSYTDYYDYDGVTSFLLKRFETGGTYGNRVPHLETCKILTNTMYARLLAYNSDTATRYLYYGYSGFKLSQPLWTPKRLTDIAKTFKMKTDLPLPDPIKKLDKYKALILGLDPAKPDDYALGIILEEDAPLAVDEKGFAVERKSAYVKADTLADLITKFKSGAIDYVKAGYEPYLKKWKAEGIDFGIV